MRDARMTRTGRRLRNPVLGPLGHEEFRRMVRETYPTLLDRVGPGWLERFGHEVDWSEYRGDVPR